MSLNRRLENRQYLKFVVENIMRPFSNQLPEDVLREATYGDIPEIAEEYPEWWGMVRKRIAAVYGTVDETLWPYSDDRTAEFIKWSLFDVGVDFQPYGIPSGTTFNRMLELKI